MSRRLTRIHRRSFVKATKEIVTHTTEAGGKASDVMIVLESTICAVLMFLYRDKEMAIQMFDDALVPRIAERLKEYGTADKTEDETEH